MRRLRCALLATLLLPAALAAQQVVQVGGSDVALDRRVRRLLASERTLVIARDTLIPAADTVRADVLVLDASFVLEGTVTGDLVGVDAGLWIRAGSRVDGDLVNIAGRVAGLSRQPDVGGGIFDFPEMPYHVNRLAGRMEIVARERPLRFQLDSGFGWRTLRYDRVDGVSVDIGASYTPPLVGPVQPRIHGWVGWRTQRGALAGGGDLTFRAGATTLSGSLERLTRTPDAWVRTTNLNSLEYLWDADDYRNYYQADRVGAWLRHEVGDERKRFHAVLGVGAQVEDAVSLAAGAPWHILGDSVRANPAVDDGRISSALASLRTTWAGTSILFETGALTESGRAVQGGEFDFNRFEAWGDWAIQALAHHTLEVRWRLQAPLPGTDSLPRQRWSTVGGLTTLQTYPIAFFRGDRVAFVRTDYILPFPEWLALPGLGAPSLHLIHAAGRAWTNAATDTKLLQNVGTELSFKGVYVRYMVDPAGDTDASLVVGLRSPFGEPYPWVR